MAMAPLAVANGQIAKVLRAMPDRAIIQAVRFCLARLIRNAVKVWFDL